MAILTLRALLHDAINSTRLEIKYEILIIPNNKLSTKNCSLNFLNINKFIC